MFVDLNNLDIKTIIVMLSIALCMQVSIAVFLSFLVKQYRGIKIFAAGRILGLISYSLIFSAMQPLSIMVGIGSCLLLISASLACLGIARFVNKTFKVKYFVCFNLIFILIQVCLITFYDIFLYKTIVTSIFHIVILCLTAYFLWDSSKRGLVESSRFLIAVSYSMALILVLRIVALARNPPTNFFVPNEANALSLIFVFVYSFLLTGGFTVMVCQRLYQDLQMRADTDELTRLLNRRAMLRLLNRELSFYMRENRLFAVILIDVDRFKKVNDQYGHDGGDAVLMHLAQILQSKLRVSDFASRWGGEEFLILLSNISLRDAVTIAERLRTTVASTPTSSGIHITISLGVAAIATHGTSIEAVIMAADHALYDAKRSGRNQTKIASEMSLFDVPLF